MRYTDMLMKFLVKKNVPGKWPVVTLWLGDSQKIFFIRWHITDEKTKAS